MAYIEKFLGRRVEVPEDRRYYAKQAIEGIHRTRYYCEHRLSAGERP